MGVKRTVITGIIALAMLLIGIGIGGASVPPKTVTMTSTLWATTTIPMTVTETAIKALTETVTKTVIETATETMISTVKETITNTETKTVTETMTTTKTDTLTTTTTSVSVLPITIPITTTLMQTLTQTITTTSYVLTTIPVTTTVTSSITIPMGGYSGTYNAGEVFRIGNFEFTVLGYTTTKYIKKKSIFGDYYYYYSAKPNMKVVVVWLMVRNIGTKVDNPSRLWIYYYLITVMRNTYEECDVYDLSSVGSEVDSTIVSQAIEYVDLSRDLSPDESFIATIIFQIMETDEPAILLIEYFEEFYIVPLR